MLLFNSFKKSLKTLYFSSICPQTQKNMHSSGRIPKKEKRKREERASGKGKNTFLSLMPIPFNGFRPVGKRNGTERTLLEKQKKRKTAGFLCSLKDGFGGRGGCDGSDGDGL